MKSKLITVVPVWNGAEFIAQTLQSIVDQTVQPDRVIVQDNSSTDNTEEVVKNFKGLKCEWRQNGKNLLSFGNFNRGLEFAEETDYLHLLCADDLITPTFYARLIQELDSSPGLGLGYCLDERIDENNERLSISGKVTGATEVQRVEDFLREKAEISNQAFSASLLKTAYQKSPVLFGLEYIILGDVVFWAKWAKHCKKIVRIHEPLAQYRWHASNGTMDYAPELKSLVLDEWEVMQMIEELRGVPSGFIRQFKLKGLFAVRSGIKAKRFRQIQKADYSRQIVKAARKISGPMAWYMAQVLVETRDFAVYTLGSRKRHPKNVYG